MTTYKQKIIVGDNQTAAILGSGLLPVFSTPSLVALLENTAMHIIEHPEGKSSVGTAINVKHLKASKVGEEIECIATLTSQEGSKYSFEIVAYDSKGDKIGEATHDRYLIDVARFMGKL